MIVSQDQEDGMEMEGIINTQESTITEVHQEEQSGILKGKQVMQVEAVDVNKKKKTDQQERRRCERLKRDIHITTQEKIDAAAKKRCLEGNPSKPTVLADVSNDHLIDLAKNMGIIVNDENFATFDMIKEIETARHCLYDKQLKANATNVCESNSEPVDNA